VAGFGAPNDTVVSQAEIDRHHILWPTLLVAVWTP
jgi:hypothetical protein